MKKTWKVRVTTYVNGCKYTEIDIFIKNKKYGLKVLEKEFFNSNSLELLRRISNIDLKDSTWFKTKFDCYITSDSFRESSTLLSDRVVRIGRIIKD